MNGTCVYVSCACLVCHWCGAFFPPPKRGQHPLMRRKVSTTRVSILVAFVWFVIGVIPNIRSHVRSKASRGRNCGNGKGIVEKTAHGEKIWKIVEMNNL